MNFKLCVFVHQFNRIGLILVFLFCCNHLFAQEWYKNLKKEHNQYRFGIGIQATEPTGLMINVFKGTFCSGENAFETSLIWEAFLGFENVFLDKKMDFEGARWGKGGIQGGVNVLRSLFAYEGGNFSYQLMPGIGLQFGERKYNVLNETVTDGTSGINLILRSQMTGHGITIGRSLFFASYFLELKYHNQFGESFSYTKPGFGVIFRKVR